MRNDVPFPGCKCVVRFYTELAWGPSYFFRTPEEGRMFIWQFVSETGFYKDVEMEFYTDEGKATQHWDLTRPRTRIRNWSWWAWMTGTDEQKAWTLEHLRSRGEL